MSELVHHNRRRGFDIALWGALYSFNLSKWVAVVPKSAGDHHHESIGIFDDAESASAAAVKEWRARQEAAPHLDGFGEVCTCKRGVRISQNWNKTVSCAASAQEQGAVQPEPPPGHKRPFGSQQSVIHSLRYDGVSVGLTLLSTH
jgi:hypothetical protein